MINPNNETDRQTPFPGPSARQRPQTYKFSPEEMRVMRECAKESFYYRCLPLSAALGGLTYYGVNIGYLRRSTTFGAVPKVATAVILGYLIGKFSYHQKCAEKFMLLPDSKIGRMMKARRLGIVDDTIDPSGSNFSINPFGGITEHYSDIPDSSLNDDYNSRPTPEGLDDSFRPSLDNQIVLHEEEMPPEQKHVTTYDELRKKNREEYEQKRMQAYRQSPTNAPLTLPTQPRATGKEPEFRDDYKPASSEPKNKYGDIWG